MSTPTVTPELPHWYPNLDKESHAVKMAHQLMYQAFQQHETALGALNDKIIAQNDKITALEAKANAPTT